MPTHKRWLLYVAFVLVTVWVTVADCSAGDWEFNIFGINPADFKGRSVPVIIVGAASSFLVHEAGHMLVASTMADGFHFKGGAVICEGYYKMSHRGMQLFHAGGFIAQALAGTLLTAVPYTRHSDFALGFNGFTSVNSLAYTFKSDPVKHPTSDVARLDNGQVISVGLGTYATMLSLINLNKED